MSSPPVGIYILIIVLLFFSSPSVSQSLPRNASPKTFGGGWECNRGYYRAGQGCVKVQIPKNASLDFLGHDWECNRGYYRVGQGCVRVQIPENAKLDFLGHGWECNRGYKKSNNSCVPMSGKELQQQREIEQALVAEMERRRLQGVSGDDCEREYKTNAEVCVKITRSGLDCNEGYGDDYYEDCDVMVGYRLQTDYQGGTYIGAEVECEVEIEYKGRQTYLTLSDSDSRDESHSLYAYGSDSETVDFNFSFSSYQEITSVQISNASCEIDSLDLY